MAGKPLELIVDSGLRVVGPLPPVLAEKLRSTFTIDNPVWTANDRAGRWNGATPETLDFFHEDRDGSFTVPRGALGLTIWFIRGLGLRWRLVDRSRTLPAVRLGFTGVLKPYQMRAARRLFERDFGVLQAPTGSGKTVVALAMISARRQPALIVVHTKELLEQWLARIGTFLDLPPEQVGVIGGGRMEIGRPVTVAMIQSLYKVVEHVVPSTGHLVVDECHRCPSRTFSEAVSAFDGRFMLGLSATPWRRDGLTRLIGWHLGPKVEIPRADLTAADLVSHVEVIVRQTTFTSPLDGSSAYGQMLSELTKDADRNRLIATDVAAEVKTAGGICLVLSDRKAHCRVLHELVRQRGCRVDLLTGGMPDAERRAVVERVQAGQVEALIATGQLIGEGFDARCLRAVFLATPIAFDGRLLQYLGRILRPAPGKDRATVYDYVDVNVGVLEHSANRRQRVYAALGGEVDPESNRPAVRNRQRTLLQT